MSDKKSVSNYIAIIWFILVSILIVGLGTIMTIFHLVNRIDINDAKDTIIQTQDIGAFYYQPRNTKYEYPHACYYDQEDGGTLCNDFEDLVNLSRILNVIYLIAIGFPAAMNILSWRYFLKERMVAAVSYSILSLSILITFVVFILVSVISNPTW